MSCAPDAKAVVITGQGKIFSAGVDLKRLAKVAPTTCANSCRLCISSMTRCFIIPKPVVAAVNGHAIAGGGVLSCCADRRIMARGIGRIGITELLVGVPFPALAFEIVRFAVPPRYLAEFALGGATYPSDAALQRGWVDEVVEPDALMHARHGRGKAFAALSPPAFRADQDANPPGRDRTAHSQRRGRPTQR